MKLRFRLEGENQIFLDAQRQSRILKAKVQMSIAVINILRSLSVLLFSLHPRGVLLLPLHERGIQQQLQKQRQVL